MKKFWLFAFLLSAFFISSCGNSNTSEASRINQQNESSLAEPKAIEISPERHVKVKSEKGFDETYAALKEAIESKKPLQIVAELDHSANAKKAEMELRPTKVIMHGFEKDEWGEFYEKVMDADILVLGTPIWLGEKSSVCSRVIERLYAETGKTNEFGQYIYYGKAGGCIITGNEDGIKHCAMNIFYSLQHLGYTIPPQSDAGWIGEAGPGPSYLDKDSGGEENEFTQRNTTFMTWNLMHIASILKEIGGIPAYGNVKTDWDDGERFDYQNPEHR